MVCAQIKFYAKPLLRAKVPSRDYIKRIFGIEIVCRLLKMKKLFANTTQHKLLEFANCFTKYTVCYGSGTLRRNARGLWPPDLA